MLGLEYIQILPLGPAWFIENHWISQRLLPPAATVSFSFSFDRGQAFMKTLIYFILADLLLCVMSIKEWRSRVQPQRSQVRHTVWPVLEDLHHKELMDSLYSQALAPVHLQKMKSYASIHGTHCPGCDFFTFTGSHHGDPRNTCDLLFLTGWTYLSCIWKGMCPRSDFKSMGCHWLLWLGQMWVRVCKTSQWSIIREGSSCL